MNLEALLSRLESGESLEIEYKSATGGVPKNIWETFSAFANTSGGWILLGVAQVGKAFMVQGLNNAAAMKQDIVNALRNPQKISREVCARSDIEIESIEGVQIIVVRVRAASSREKPVFINDNPYRGTFVRRNEGDYHCSKQEVDRMIRDAGAESADSAILKGYTWDQINKDTLARYRRQYQSLNPSNAKATHDDDRFLKAIGGYRKDLETGEEGFTRAAILMFGTEEAIHNLRPRHLIDFRLVVGPGEHERRWEDRLICEGNLYDAFQQIYPRLVAPLKTPFKLEGPYRLTETAAHEALREALVNMLAHADYSEQAALLVTASPQEFTFRNPGSSRIPEEDLLTGDHSDPRNPVLIRMFRQVSLAEEAGTGIPKILKIWREAGLKLPAVVSDTERYEFSLILKLVHLIAKEDRAWLAWCAKQSGGSDQLVLPGAEELTPLSDNEQLALLQARSAGSITNASVQALTGLHRTDVTNLLSSLKDRGLLVRESSGRWASYKLPARFAIAYEKISINKIYKEPKKSIKKKSLKERIIYRILRLCLHPRSAKEIAKAIKKNPIYLVTHYLSPMIKQGQLAYTNPNHINSRNQKYVAVHK